MKQTNNSARGVDEFRRLIAAAKDISTDAMALADDRPRCDPVALRKFDDNMVRVHCYASRALLIASRACRDRGNRDEAVKLAESAAKHDHLGSTITENLARDERNRI